MSLLHRIQRKGRRGEGQQHPVSAARQQQQQPAGGAAAGAAALLLLPTGVAAAEGAAAGALLLLLFTSCRTIFPQRKGRLCQGERGVVTVGGMTLS